MRRTDELVLHDVEVGNEHVRGRASDGMLGPSSDSYRVEHCEHAARAEGRDSDLHSRGNCRDFAKLGDFGCLRPMLFDQ
jgi:hypothetical protein